MFPRDTKILKGNLHLLWVTTIFTFFITTSNVQNLGYCSSYYEYLVINGAFAFNLCISIKFEMVKIQAFNEPMIWSNFDSKLLKFKVKMNSHVIDVLTPFLTFSSSYIDVKAHNMNSSCWTFVLKTLKSYKTMWTI